MTLSTLIRFRREAQGLSVTELAAAVGIHPSRIYDLEAGRRGGMSFRFAVLLARELKIRLDDLAAMELSRKIPK